MTIKTFTDRARSGQTTFHLPPFSGTPTATVNGSNAALTVISGGVKLTAAAAQDDTVKITANVVDAANFHTEFASPATGATVVTTALADSLLITPAGTIAALTVTFPPSPSKEGQQFRVMTTQTITALTFTGGSKLGAPTTLAANTSVTFEWSVAKSEWVRI